MISFNFKCENDEKAKEIYKDLADTLLSDKNKHGELISGNDRFDIKCNQDIYFTESIDFDSNNHYISINIGESNYNDIAYEIEDLGDELSAGDLLAMGNSEKEITDEKIYSFYFSHNRFGIYSNTNDKVVKKFCEENDMFCIRATLREIRYYIDRFYPGNEYSIENLSKNTIHNRERII